MKGLLTKDFYMTLKYCKFLFLIDIVFIAVSFMSKDNVLFMMFPILFAGVIPTTLLSCDERCGWTVYSGTMPYSRAQLVSAKYIMGPVIAAAFAAVIMALMPLRMSLLGETDFAGAAGIVGIMFAGSLLFPMLCLPFCFIFGTEKGRIVNFVLTLLVTLGVTSIADADTGSFDIKGIMPIIPAAIALLYAVSWVISIALCRRKA